MLTLLFSFLSCRYVIAKQVTGQKISFRFEMASSSEKQDTHMMVTRGRFKQIKPPPLEQIGVREIGLYDTCWWYSLCNF